MIDGTPRFLIVRLGSLGDVVHAIPAVAALRRRHPTALIDWMVDPKYSELLSLVTSIDRAIALDPRERWTDLIETARDLRRRHYDAVIDLQGLLKSALLARAAGGRRTIGFPRAHLRETLASAFYSETPDPGEGPHVIHKALELMRALDVRDSTIEFPLLVPSSTAAEHVAAGLGGTGYALINPGAAWANKRWPADRFGRLAASIRERHNLRSVVLWGPGEESLAGTVIAASAGAAALAPPTSIPDIMAVAKGADVMISGDTGPLHLGAAVGTPLVALFGPTRAERNGPWASKDISVSVFDRCECHYERKCRRGTACIDTITLDEVVAAVDRRIADR